MELPDNGACKGKDGKTVELLSGKAEVIKLNLEVEPGADPCVWGCADCETGFPGFCRRKPFCYRIRVLCAETGEGLPGVSVRVKNGVYSESGKTGEAGEAVFRLPSTWRRIELQFRKEGFCSRYIGTHWIVEEKESFRLWKN